MEVILNWILWSSIANHSAFLNIFQIFIFFQTFYFSLPFVLLSFFSSFLESKKPLRRPCSKFRYIDANLGHEKKIKTDLINYEQLVNCTTKENNTPIQLCFKTLETLYNLNVICGTIFIESALWGVSEKSSLCESTEPKSE